MDPDASRLIQYADQFGYRWRWKTEPKDGAWDATVQLMPPNDPAPMFGSAGATEQSALDRAIDHAIHYDEDRRGVKRPINMRDAC